MYVMTMTASPIPVHELRGGNLLTSLQDEAYVFVKSEEDPSKVLFNSRIIKGSDSYQLQQDSLIVWTEPNGTDMALSFQEAEGCTIVWDSIRWVQNYNPALVNHKLSDDPETTDRHLPTSPFFESTNTPESLIRSQPIRSQAQSRPHAYTDAEWSEIRPIFTRLYVEEHRRLRDVVMHLKTRYDFHVAEKMCKKRIATWRLSRNKTAKDKEAALEGIAQGNCPPTQQEQSMKILFGHDIAVLLDCSSRAGSVSVSMRYDSGSSDNIIGASFLNNFKWSAQTTTRPSIGESVRLSLLHPRFATRQQFDFVVVPDPDAGITVGGPACKQLQAVWSKEMAIG